MEINLECSGIFNEEFSEFLDNNSQICLNPNHHEPEDTQNDEVKTENMLKEVYQEENKDEQKSEFYSNSQAQDFTEELNKKTQTKSKVFKLVLPNQLSKQCKTITQSLHENTNTTTISKTKLDCIKVLGSVQSTQNPTTDDKQQTNSSNQQEIKIKILGKVTHQKTKPPVPILILPSISYQGSPSGDLQLTQNHQTEQSNNYTPTQLEGNLLGSTASSNLPSNRQWQKVTVNKRRSNTTTNQKRGEVPPLPQKTTSTSSSIQKPKNHIPINISNLKGSEEENYPRTYREHLLSSPQAKGETTQRRQKPQPGEIVPLFDCLFCCQEHFVLAKVSETCINSKYVKNEKELGRYIINKQMKLNIGKIEEFKEIKDNKNQGITEIGKNIEEFRRLVENNSQLYQSTLLKGYLKIIKTKPRLSSIVHSKPNIPPLSLQSIPSHHVNFEINNQASNHMLDDLSDSILLDNSRCLGKTRRQRIIEGISFETDCHNIYDPHFTSEEEIDQNSSIIISEPHHQKYRSSHKHKEVVSENSLDSQISSSSSYSLEEQNDYSSDQEEISHHQDKKIGTLQNDRSLSSIEREIDDEDVGFHSDTNEDEKQIVSLEFEKIAGRLSTNLNIQENKFTPEMDEKESQRYTFGCITPTGIVLAMPSGEIKNDISPFNRALSSQSSQSLRLRNGQNNLKSQREKQSSQFKYELIEPIQIETNQSPTSCQKDIKLIDDLSPVIRLETTKKFRDPSILRLSEQNLTDGEEGKINFYPSALVESIEDIPNLTRITPMNNAEYYDMSIKIPQQANSAYHKRGRLGPIMGGGHHDKESCFSPIQQNDDDQSLSREGAIAVAAARDLQFQENCFSSEDSDDITMIHFQEQNPQQLQSLHMYQNHPKSAITKFPKKHNNLVINDSNLSQTDPYADTIGVGVCNPCLDPHTINLGYNQSQSFSAFNSKHVLASNYNQTPIVINKMNDISVPQNEERFITENDQSNRKIKSTKGKKKKKFLIKQEQLSILLKKALEKRISKTASNIHENTVSSDIQINNNAISLFDSAMKNGQDCTSSQDNDHNNMGNQIQSMKNLKADTNSSECMNIPKHKKMQKTEDFSSQPDIRQSQQNLIGVTHLSDFSKAPPKVPLGGTTTQNPRKQMAQKQVQEDAYYQPSRQQIFSGSRAKNYHLSFNNLILQQNQKQLIDQESKAPLTLRSNYQDQQAPVTNTKVKATSNMTKEELNQYLRSAICSSRYSTSSNMKIVTSQMSNEKQSHKKPSKQFAEDNRSPKQLLKQDPILYGLTMQEQVQSMDLANKLFDRKESIKVLMVNEKKHKLPLNISGSVEKRKSVPANGERHPSKQLKASKKNMKQTQERVAELAFTSKIQKKKQKQQMELQTYYNLCNSINFSNDISVPSNQKPLVNASLLVKEKMFNTNNNNNSSSIINITNQHVQNFNQGPNQTTIQDTSNNILAMSNTTGQNHYWQNQTSSGGGQQCEMSTTISNNQLSLTRLNNGRTGASNGKTNVNNQSSSLVLGASKVIVPQLQLSKLKNSGSKKHQLNGSHDEIQLQNLLMNLNQHLQSQPRASLLQKDGGSTFTSSTPNANLKNGGNAKRSQASSLSLQRQQYAPQPQTIQGINKRKESLEPPLSTSNQIPKLLLKQLNQTVQTLKKKQEALPPTTAIANQRRKKSTVEVGSNNKMLQNSFTLKQLKVIMATQQQMGLTHASTSGFIQPQLSMRQQQNNIETQRGTERSNHQRLVGESAQSKKERQPSKKLKATNKGSSKHFVTAHQKQNENNNNRHSLLSKKSKKNLMPDDVQSNSTLNLIKLPINGQTSDMILNRFYETSGKNLTAGMQSPQRSIVVGLQKQRPPVGNNTQGNILITESDNSSAPPKNTLKNVKQIGALSFKKLDIPLITGLTGNNFAVCNSTRGAGDLKLQQ